MQETRARTLAKAIVYRLLATALAIVLVFFYTGNVGTSLQIAVLLNVTKTVLYYVHDRAWTQIEWGLRD